MDEPVVKKRVDETWKEQADREKRAAETVAQANQASARGAAAPQPPGAEEVPEARFDLFISGLAMETLIAMGDMPHPSTRKQTVNLPQAKYLIDLLGVLEEKTRGNLSVEEEKLFKDTLYQLRMRYLSKTGP
ncbi:MAG: DUF1844 domain-containing protein [Candidatus Omnitrophica bacterium]|nr:DUF1844 domain-containing protein [Candidatus Omnitrophota bacterium]